MLRAGPSCAAGLPHASRQTGVSDQGSGDATDHDRSDWVVDVDGRFITQFGRFGNYDGQFRLAHDRAVANDTAGPFRH